MSYRVRIDSFEGPFDLLLYLVSRQKVDIGTINITQISDQYLEEMGRMGTLDLDVASDFLVVASTLLQIKAESLLSRGGEELPEEVDELAPSQARDVLVERLLVYKQYKNAAAALRARHEAEGRMHARPFGPDAPFLEAMPDYLAGVTLEDLARKAAAALGRREVFLLESEHIAAKPLAVEARVEAISRRLSAEGSLRFSQLVGPDAPVEVVVVTFLALLELYKRAMVNIEQEREFGDMDIRWREGAEAPAPPEEG